MRFTKLRGQHILTDASVAERIVAAADLTAGETVLEVGPGLGVLTRLILPRVKKYLAVELDPRFVDELKAEFAAEKSTPNIIEGDILKINIAELLSFYNLQATTYKLVSNLPYNITSAFLKKILTEEIPPERVVVMIQREVAERICRRAAPDVERANLLGFMCNLYAECEYLFNVSAGSFNPPPRVESAVIRFKPYSAAAFFEKWRIDRSAAEAVVGFVAIFFKNPRKMMSNALGRDKAEAVRTALVALHERSDSRPADLSLEKWISLWKIMSEK